MRAAVFRGVGQLPIEHVPDPVAGPWDIVVEVKSCAIAGADLAAYGAGRFAEVGQVMGHKFAGAVVHVGSEIASIGLGDRVTGPPVQPCGTCRRCREGAGHLCAAWRSRSIGYGLPGAFAELVRIPDAVLGGNVHRLPDTLTYDEGALAGPLAVSVHAVHQAAPAPGLAACVLGLGPVGLLTAQVLLDRGVSPVIGVDDSVLRRAAGESLGVTVLDSTGDPRDAAGDEIGYTFESSGTPALVERAIEAVHPGGMVVFAARYGAPVPVDAGLVARKELVLRGSAAVASGDFREAIDLLASGAVRTQPLITHRRRLDQIDEAFHLQRDTEKSIQVVISGEA